MGKGNGGASKGTNTGQGGRVPQKNGGKKDKLGGEEGREDSGKKNDENGSKEGGNDGEKLGAIKEGGDGEKHGGEYDGKIGGKHSGKDEERAALPVESLEEKGKSSGFRPQSKEEEDDQVGDVVSDPHREGGKANVGKEGKEEN